MIACVKYCHFIYRSRLCVVGVVVVALMIMICSAVVSIAPASSCVGSGPSED